MQIGTCTRARTLHAGALLGLIAALALPAAAAAAAPDALARTGRSLIVATSSPGNAFVGGLSVVTAAPVAGDLTAVGGTLAAAAPVAGDALLIGGSAKVRANVSGDLRMLAGTAVVEKPVGGDLGVLAGRLRAEAPVAGSIVAFALDAVAIGGAGGPVTIYGNTVTLGGVFAGDVRVVALDRLALLPGTIVHGTLEYQAPIPAAIPPSATVAGGVRYTAASYLPGTGISKTLALVSIGVFLLARVVASVILAGILAGLFPRLAERVVDEGYGRSVRHLLLVTLLGFAAFVATPILALLLLLTLVGGAVALLLGIAYALLVLLALAYAGITLGGVFARRVLARREVLWRDGALGALALSVVALIPVVGLAILLMLASFAAGALLSIAFRFAFSNSPDGEML